MRNLDDPDDRRRVYETVLSVGDAAADVETYIDPRPLLDALPAMTKSLAVRQTWDAWTEHHMALWR